MQNESLIQKKIKQLSSFIAPVSDVATAAGSIPEKLLIEPNMPVGVFIQESFNIHFFAQDDRDLLISRGLNWGIIDELPKRVGHLQKCESVWWKARFALSPAAKEYLKARELVQITSAELMRAFEYLADSDDEIAKAIDDIKKGSGDQDFMADMFRLCGLCQDKQEQLKTIGCKPQLFETMERCSAAIPNLQMNYKLDNTASSAQSERDQAYTFLLVAIEEIRRCARHAFWDDKKHLKGYLSEYFRRRKE